MQTTHFDLSRLYEHNPPIFYEKDRVRELFKKITLIATSVFFLGYLGSITLLKATPAVLGFTVRFCRNSSIALGLTALASRFLDRGKDHPQSIRKLEQEISHKLIRGEGLNKVLNQYPAVEVFVAKEPACQKEISNYLNQKISHGALRSVPRARDFYRKEGEYVQFMQENSPFRLPAQRICRMITEFKAEKNAFKNQQDAVKERLKREYGVQFLEGELREKKSALTRARQEKKSSGFNALGGVSGAVGHLDNDRKMREQTHVRSELENLQRERALSPSERERLEVLYKSINDLEQTTIAYNDLERREREIESLERQVNSILYGRRITHKELCQEKASLDRKISHLEPQSKYSTAYHVGSAALNTWNYFSLNSRIRELEEEVRDLEDRLRLAQLRVEPHISRVEQQTQTTIIATKDTFSKSLQQTIESFLQANHIPS